jgi:uncharacterized phage-associated protein
MATAHDAAAFLIAEQCAAGRPIDKMQLQKLLYLAQGAHLELWGRQAFEGSFQAYTRGPVEPAVERTYRNVSPGTDPIDRVVGGDPKALTPEEADTLRLVLHHYGSWTGPNLERLVKRPGSPWQKARGGLAPDASSREPIPADTMAGWFRRHGLAPTPPKILPSDEDLFRRAAEGDLEALSQLTA